MIKKIVINFFLSFSLGASAQLTQKLDSLFQSYHENGLFEGTALIADSTGIVYHRSFGFANQDYQIPNDTLTIYRLGSLEKQFTAMLTLQLIEKEKLHIDGKITDYLPKYRKDTGDKVTIEHLLTHTSGLPNYTALPNVWNDSLRLSYKPEYILQNFCSGDFEFTPGSRYKYSNTDYFVLGQIIQKVTGKQLIDVLNENIFIPIGMNHTGLVDNVSPIRKMAYGYYRLGDTYINEPYIYVPNTIGAASIYSTAYDLFLWDRALYSNVLLSDNYSKSYSTSHQQIAPGYAYGYGWEFTRTDLILNDTIETMEHSGAIRAFRSNIFRIPKEKKCIIILSNNANQSAYDLFENSMQIFRGNEWKKPRKILSDTLYPIMQQASIKSAIRTFKDLKKDNSTLYDFSSESLELFGERLMLLQKYQEAVAIFSLAVEENPEYSYGYLYLGRAYEKLGDYEEAIKAYKTAVDIDKNSRPGNDAAFQLNQLSKN